MKIMLVAPKFDIFPVGIAYIASSLKVAGHDVDCSIFDKPETLDSQLRKKRFDFLATGGLSSQYSVIDQILTVAKTNHIKVIVGGGIITSEPELISKALNIDYAVIGEGETTIVELLSYIENKQDISGVYGIGYFNNGHFVVTPSRIQTEDLDQRPFPDYEAFGYSKYLDAMRSSDLYLYDVFDHPREYPIITSRSCPFLCTFCYHPAGDKYRQRSLDSIMSEIESVVKKHKINIISIYDELFSYNDERVYDFCRRLLKFQETLPWKLKWGCQMRVSGLKDSMLDAMRESGCIMVSYGFESYSPVVLKSMKKHITPDEIHHAIHATLERGMSIQAGFIFGDKAETLDTAKVTLDFWREHRDAGIMLGNILPFPNSAMYQRAIAKGIIIDKLDFIKHHLFETYNLTEMPDKDFLALQTLRLQYTFKYYTYTVPLRKTRTHLSVRCPHCNEIIEYDNFIVDGFVYNKMMYCRNCRKRYFAASRLFKLYAQIIALIATPGIVSAVFVYRRIRSALRAGTYIRGLS